MNAFEQAGAAMLQAEQAKVLLARAMAAQVKIWFAGLRSWLGDMPTTLPPTESIRR